MLDPNERIFGISKFLQNIFLTVYGLDHNQFEFIGRKGFYHKYTNMATIDIPPLEAFAGKDSFFGGEPPLSEGIGYFVVLGFGAFFSVFTTILVYMNKYFRGSEMNSEHFKYVICLQDIAPLSFSISLF